MKSAIQSVMHMENMVVWITGASSGIGKSLAEQCHARGARVILSARRKHKLEELKEQLDQHESSRTAVLPLDMEQHQSLPGAAESAEAFWGHIDILIHNAGVSQRSLAVETEYTVLRRIMDINIIGAAELTRLVLPSMIARGSGRIAAAGSIAGKFATPYRSSYSASKMAMQGYFDALRAEAAPFGIQVTMLILGGIRTDISRNALKGDGNPHGTMDPLQAEGMSADVCAEKILTAVMKKKREVAVGLTPRTRFALFLARFFPSVLAHMLQKAKVT